MIDPAAQIRALVGDYLSGVAPLKELDIAVAMLGAESIEDPDLSALWGRLELVLAERSSRHSTRREFHAALRDVLMTTTFTETTATTIGEPMRDRTGATTRIHRIAISVEQWIRLTLDRPSGTASGTVLASPAAHPA